MDQPRGRPELAANGIGGAVYRRNPLHPTSGRLYDLDDDPTEATNRATDEEVPPGVRAPAKLPASRRSTPRTMPERNHAVAVRRPQRNPRDEAASAAPTRLHPTRLVPPGRDASGAEGDPRALRPARTPRTGRRHQPTGVLDVGKSTGVFASELTVPYYARSSTAGMEVDVASPRGGAIPVDPMSLKPVIRSEADDRFLADDTLRRKVNESAPVGDLPDR